MELQGLAFQGIRAFRFRVSRFLCFKAFGFQDCWVPRFGGCLELVDTGGPLIESSDT